MTFSVFAFDVCTSPEEQDAAARRVGDGKRDPLPEPRDGAGQGQSEPGGAAPVGTEPPVSGDKG